MRDIYLNVFLINRLWYVVVSCSMPFFGDILRRGRDSVLSLIPLRIAKADRTKPALITRPSKAMLNPPEKRSHVRGFLAIPLFHAGGKAADRCQ
jgi:hypothetical protein